MKYFSFLAVFFLLSCSASGVLIDGNSYDSAEEYVEESQNLKDYFFGFQLYDLEEQEIIAQQNNHRFFTPASNTKLFTLYTSLHYLQDSLAFMQVYSTDGKQIYQPMGDPSFQHPDLETDQRISQFFEQQPGDTIHLSLQHFKDQRFGSGWAWDDYDGYYQTEKSAFPIQSNLFIFNEGHSTTHWMPIVVIDEEEGSRTARREEWENHYFLDPQLKDKRIPFHINENLYKAFFMHHGKEVSFQNEILPTTEPDYTVYSSPADSAYKVLMQNSDNHIAEQLLLQASQLQLGEMHTQRMIQKAKEELFQPVADEMNWVDGSGLSRYNMMTPNAVNWVVNQLVEEKGIEWITTVFPGGGTSGTIRNYYSYEPPRVFAKTGTLRNNHCLSGIVQAKSGKWYSFSMMNNHFPGSSSVAKTEMENILKIIIETY